MYALLAPVALALATLAAPPPTAEVIPIRYRSAVEVERILVSSATQRPDRPPHGRMLGQFDIGLVPAADGRPLRVFDGLIALTADEEHNTLTVVGDAETVEEVRSVIRFLDIPTTKILIDVRTVPASDAAVQATEAGSLKFTEMVPETTLRWVAVPGEKEAAALAATPAATRFLLETPNNHPVRLRWSGQAKADWPGTTLTPRINGDGSVTVFIGVGQAPPLTESGGERNSLYVLRRIRPGQTIVVVPGSADEALVVTVRELLPPTAKPK
jgi:hypothetical protein